jgi:type II secretory pathway pseudopilin PulG
MTLRSQRGSGLLLAMIVVLVITVIAVGVVRFSSRELAGAYAGRHQDALVACAEAGRQLLLSQFRALGVQPVALTALNVPLDNPATGQTRVLGGHYDSNVQVQQVSILPDGTFGPDPNSVQDRSNRIFVTRLGSGSPYKVMVHCQDRGDGTMNSGRQLEVEFGVRFGL